MRNTSLIWRHIPWVANGLTAQGGMELVFAAVLIMGHADWDAKAAETVYDKILVYIAPFLLLLGGSLKTYAAARNRFFRSRQLGLVALWSSLPTAVVWMCAPTGLALLVYGIAIYRHELSRRAFEMGDSGRTAKDIARALVEEEVPAS